MPRMTLPLFHLRPGDPDFLDLPWDRPLAAWVGSCPRLVEMPRGLSRHEVVFVAYDARVYALKELPLPIGEREYGLLRELEERGLPAVVAVGHVRRPGLGNGGEETSVLITRFLEASLPYRALFMQPGLERYRERLLDAIAGLLVRLHLAGFLWGDCSLSNTLFRRDAGELRAYLVDAETSEFQPTLSAGRRAHDLEIMEENVGGELADLANLVALPPALEILETGAHIRARYERLWGETAREVLLRPDERYRIHERIRALNDLGFTVGELELVPSPDGEHLRLRTTVTDRDYHRHLLHSMTGVVAGDRQASLLLNEIREMQATLARDRNRSVAMSIAAFAWLRERFQPTLERLGPPAAPAADPAELYCQVLEHKWLLSEQARHDVGVERAIEDYVARFPPAAAGAAPPDGLDG
jgi:hypothetical protein